MGNRFDKWNRWLDVIHSEVRNLLINRYFFWEVQGMIRNNPKIQKHSAFYEFFGTIYSESALIGIRRQVKIDKDSISFARLLSEICKTPKVLSKTRFVDLYGESEAKEHGLPDRHFKQFAGAVGNHIDPELVRSDLEQLKMKAQKCEKYGDKRVAHFDRKGPDHIPTFKELNDCMDFLEGLIKKYLRLFRADVYLQILPVFQYDWKAIFREPWLPS
jgi:hypothetical protein